MVVEIPFHALRQQLHHSLELTAWSAYSIDECFSEKTKRCSSDQYPVDNNEASNMKQSEGHSFAPTSAVWPVWALVSSSNGCVRGQQSGHDTSQGLRFPSQFSLSHFFD